MLARYEENHLFLHISRSGASAPNGTACALHLLRCLSSNAVDYCRVAPPPNGPRKMRKARTIVLVLRAWYVGVHCGVTFRVVAACGVDDGAGTQRAKAKVEETARVGGAQTCLKQRINEHPGGNYRCRTLHEVRISQRALRILSVEVPPHASTVVRERGRCEIDVRVFAQGVE
eukprot:GEMP01029070.1.p1 GENE.GEMP01029070.1~~GEMP01029070.1.p1  ORF type:complete len:173 (-),score=41.36 GEMP01029070.1:729-1247(-)